MENRETQKGSPFIFGIIAFIVGMALFKQFDFATLTFTKRWLSLLYGLTFAAAVFLLIKDSRNKAKK